MKKEEKALEDILRKVIRYLREGICLLYVCVHVCVSCMSVDTHVLLGVCGPRTISGGCLHFKVG